MTDQLKLWRGQFGDDYHTRNVLTDTDIKNREVFWSQILNSVGDDIPKSILEIGAGNGINIQALSNIYSRFGHELYINAVEPNEKARLSLCEQNIITGAIYPTLENGPEKHDLVFTSGVLIHIHPDQLLDFTKKIYQLSNKYIVCAEYFRPEPEIKHYRGEENALFLRDYGAYWLDNYPLQCISFGFAWKRLIGVDDLTWQIFKKAH